MGFIIHNTLPTMQYLLHIIIMVRPSREIIYPVMLYGHKRETFYCAFSCLGHGPYIRRSNLANCKFTLELVLQASLPYHAVQKQAEGSKGGDSERDRSCHELNSARTS